MGMLWLLFVACVSCCLTEICCDSHEASQDHAIDESTAGLLGSVFGFRPCFDETCSGDEINVPSNEVPVSESQVTSDQYLNDYEPQDIEYPHDDPKIHCIFLRPSAVKAFAEIESRHPGISEVKYRILEEIISYASAATSLRSDKCSVEMKLLDLIIYAANKLRKEYVKLPGGICNHTIVEEEVYRPDKTDNKTHEPCTPRTGAPITLSPEYLSSESTPCLNVTEEPQPTKKVPEKPCPEPTSTTEIPCPEKPSEGDEYEIIAEDDEYNDQPPLVGSLRGIPGVHYPNYADVPITSFSCADKKYIPGFYADLETGCQVFHVCYEHRRESFLCPVGTIFNQPILACDYWYSSNCSLAPIYYEVNKKSEEVTKDEYIDEAVEEIISSIIEGTTDVPVYEHEVLEDIAKFLPVKAKVTEFPESPKVTEVVTEKPKVKEVKNIASEVFDKIPEPSKPKPQPIPVFKPEVPVFKEPVLKVKPVSFKAPLAKAAVTAAKVKLAVPAVIAKTKLAAAIPVAKVAAVKAAVPIFAKAKIASAALPVIATKAKVAAAVKVAAAKSAVTKAKLAAKVAVPLVAKAKVAAAAVPVAAKVKVAVPLVAKAKVAIPVAAKAKAAKVAVPLVAKGKVAAAAVPIAAKVKLAAAVPKVVAKAAIPALKTKMIASALPLVKTKLATPALKGKALKAVGIPLVKAKLVGSAPLMKAKLVKAAAISPLTKKALALGYMKLLKAKKLAFVG